MVRNELGNPLRNWKKWINQAMKVFGVIATIEIAQRLKVRSTCVGQGSPFLNPCIWALPICPSSFWPPLPSPCPSVTFSDLFFQLQGPLFKKGLPWVGSLLRDCKYMDGSSYKGGCLAKWSSPLLFVGCSNSLKCGQFVPKDFSLLWKWEFTSLDEAVSALCQYLPFFGTTELPGNDGLHFYRALPCLVSGMWRYWLHTASPC